MTLNHKIFSKKSEITKDKGKKALVQLDTIVQICLTQFKTGSITGVWNWA